MELYIGGYAQGKLEYVKSKYQDAEITEDLSYLPGNANSEVILNNLHMIIKSCIRAGLSKEEILKQIIELESRTGKLLIICDEIGSGIVPMDTFDRKWREETGRILCEIAKLAQSVERVFCGIGQVIK